MDTELELEMALESLKDFPSSIMPGVEIYERDGSRFSRAYTYRDEVATPGNFMALVYRQPNGKHYLYPFEIVGPGTLGELLSDKSHKFKDHLTFIS